MSSAEQSSAEQSGAEQGSRPRVLVSGASIAGPAAAYWLARAGWSVTVVERSEGLRVSGQNVDIRGPGREVIARMGLEQAVREHSTGEVGTRFVREDGSTVSEFGVTEGEGDGPTAELEILRGDLAQLLVDACPGEVTWRYGDHVTAVEQGEDGTGVEVALASGGRETYDLLVIADGVRSTTRDLVFTEGVELTPIGMTSAFGTIERTADDDDWWRWLNAPGSRQVMLRPDNHGTTRVMMSYLTTDPSQGLVGREPAEQRRELRERFGDIGWQTPRILDGLDTGDDLYVDDLTQVRCRTWSRGRVVLLGDAGWCVTPIGGGGTWLALVGAYVLAAHLSQVDDPASAAASPAVSAALADYEAGMRPMVSDVQDLPPGVPRLAAPRSRAGVTAFRLATMLAASGPVQAVVSRFSSDDPDDPDGADRSGEAAESELPPLRERPQDGR